LDSFHARQVHAQRPGARQVHRPHNEVPARASGRRVDQVTRGEGQMARVLLVLTSHDRLGDTTQGTGAWLEELAQAYFVFADSGVGVDVASPRGGAAPIDP